MTNTRATPRADQSWRAELAFMILFCIFLKIEQSQSFVPISIPSSASLPALLSSCGYTTAPSSGSIREKSIVSQRRQPSLPSRRNVQRSLSSLFVQREATFGMGCFWKPSEELLKEDGVMDTIVGYTGVPGEQSQPPTYDTVCFSRDWVEGVRVIYDDDKITYSELLNAFFETQEPKVGGSRQYASIIFPHDAEQEQAARQWLENNQNLRRSRDGLPASITQKEPLSSFYRAENYHQEYWQKTRPRIAAYIALIAVSSGILDRITPPLWQSQVHSTATAIALAGLLYVLLERKIDTNVVKI